MENQGLGREVVLIFRKRPGLVYSIEDLFDAVFETLSSQITIKKIVLPYLSTGVFNRARNLLAMVGLRRKVVHVTGDCHYVILGCLLCRRILTVHDLGFLDQTRGVKREILRLFWITLPVRFADKITVVSQTTKQALIKESKVSPDKIVVVPNFIDPIFQPVSRKFKVDKPRILQIGTAFNKNIERLVVALKGIPCRLVIIGQLPRGTSQAINEAGIEYEALSNLSKQEVFQQYVLADLLAFASTLEGFGMPILEAQATGLPVLTSNISSMPEVAGGGAVFVDPLDPESIRHGILSLISQDSLRQKIVEQGFNNVKRFSRERATRQYLQVYNEVNASKR